MKNRFALILMLLLLAGLGVWWLSSGKPAPSATAPASLAEAQAPAPERLPFRQALAGYTYQFPADHAAHPPFKTEWWYYTGHLRAKTGQRYGFELTFFRSATGLPGLPATDASTWGVPELYVAHFAVSDLDRKQFLVAEQLGRPHPQRAGASASDYHVWIGDWLVGLDEQGRHHLRATSQDATLDLTLDSDKPPAIHGKDGISQKAPCVGCASHYYSLTRLKGAGTLAVGGKPLPVEAQAWMDHEFGSNQLSSEQIGWDWFSVQLTNDEELMVYLLRRKDGTLEPTSSGTLVDRTGKTTHLALNELSVEVLDHWVSPKTKARYPMGWRLRVPGRGLDLTLRAEMPDQELVLDDNTGVSYWEGACRASGQQGNTPVTGQAYVEMTGYNKPFSQKI